MDVVRALERLHLVDVDVCLAFSRGRQIRRFALFVDFGMLDRAFDGIFQNIMARTLATSVVRGAPPNK